MVIRKGEKSTLKASNKAAISASVYKDITNTHKKSVHAHFFVFAFQLWKSRQTKHYKNETGRDMQGRHEAIYGLDSHTPLETHTEQSLTLHALGTRSAVWCRLATRWWYLVCWLRVRPCRDKTFLVLGTGKGYCSTKYARGENWDVSLTNLWVYKNASLCGYIFFNYFYGVRLYFIFPWGITNGHAWIR